MKESETPHERAIAYAAQRFDRGEFQDREDYRAEVQRINREYGKWP